MSMKPAVKCLKGSSDSEYHVHKVTLPKRLRRRTTASSGLRGLEKASNNFFQETKRIEENEQHLLRVKENRERYSYNQRNFQGCKRYTEDAKPYFTKEEWVKACAEAALKKLSPPEGNKKMYIYE